MIHSPRFTLFRPAGWLAMLLLIGTASAASAGPKIGYHLGDLAPNLTLSRIRLRHDWINDWIRRPDEWMPGTRMPTNFPKGETGQRTSPLAALVDAPAFAKDRAEFAGMLGGDDAARKFLGDPDAVTRALRDYVWSIGVNGGTAPAGTPPAAETKPAPGTRASARAAGHASPAAP